VLDALRVGIDEDADMTSADIRKLADAIEDSVRRIACVPITSSICVAKSRPTDCLRTALPISTATTGSSWRR
jgi:hypothetical protein